MYVLLLWNVSNIYVACRNKTFCCVYVCVRYLTVVYFRTVLIHFVLSPIRFACLC